jgi:hypothetical protein
MSLTPRVARADVCGFRSDLPGDSNGFLDNFKGDFRMVLWERLGGARFDETQKTEIPIHLSFTPILGHQGSPILGQGFLLMPFDATFVQKSVETFTMTQPSGHLSTLYKTRNPTVLKGGGWIAKVSGAGANQTITAESSCGWTIAYTGGRLAQMISPKKEVFDFSTDGQGSRQVNRNGRKLMTLRRDFDPKTTLPMWHLDFISEKGPKHAVLKMGHRQILVTLPDKKTREEGRRSLASIQFDNEPERRYNFKINELDCAGHVFKWDPNSGNLLENADKKFKLVRVKGVQCIQISRPDRHYIYGRDDVRGLEISPASGSNETLVVEKFIGGIYSGIAKKIYTIDESGKEKMKRQYWYDENRKVIKMLSNDGDDSTTFERKGNTVRAFDNIRKKIIWEKRHDSKSRIIFFKHHDSEYHFNYKEDDSKQVILSARGKNGELIQKEISLDSLTMLLKDFEFGRFQTH